MTRLARQELQEFRQTVENDATDAERDEKVAREMERLERRRARRAERKNGTGKEPAQSVPEQPKPKEVEVGSKVKIEGQDMVGVVQSMKGKKAQVAFGQILTTVDKERLVVVSNSEYREATRPVTPRTVIATEISERRLNFSRTVDVRGMRVVEALDKVQDLVDDALMVGVDTVTVLHGKGTGALKEEIRAYLRTIPHIGSVRDEHPDMGGAGITVITFK
jgi:DNA mismatch repair protein MutS2